jgi:uncharacterized membrane protein YecN with MAPEG domain
MILLAPVTSFTAIILAVLFVKLAFAVIKKRQVHKVALGTGQHSDLEAAIRAHGNFAEYVPLALLLIACAEINRAPWWLAAIAAVALVAGRTIHAMAIAGSDLKKRVLGMQLTFASLALGIVANLVALAIGLISMTKS